MSFQTHTLASGAGWCVHDAICTAGPHNRPFEERHDVISIAAVAQGTFQYRSPVGAAVLAPGAILLGNIGHCFECGHDHGVGDRCLSFRLTPGFVEGVAAAIPGVRRISFAVPRLPPSSSLLPLFVAAESAREAGDAMQFEEIVLRLTGVVFETLTECRQRICRVNRRDERRITTALRHIEAHCDDHLSLADLARAAAMSPYHFLRTFRAIVGMTPYQFILYTRLRRAAVRLRETDTGIADIAFAAGFGDLSTFNRRFQRIMGRSPRAFRADALAGSASKRLRTGTQQV